MKLRMIIVAVMTASMLIPSALVLAQQAPPPPGPSQKRPTEQMMVGEPGGPSPPVFLPPLSDEQEQEVLEFMQTNEPHKFEKLQTVKDVNPMKYRELLQRSFREIKFLQRLEKEDPPRYQRVVKERKLDNDAHQLAEQYRKSKDEGENQQLKKELRQVLNQAFDLRQQNRVQEMQDLEKRLTELKKVMEQREKNKANIVDKRLEELTSKAKVMEW